MAREVIWTASALRDRKSILAYWKGRNGNTTYSQKLYGQWEAAIKLITINPYLGRPTRYEAIRVRLVGHYNIFYQPDTNVIRVVRVIDGRRDLSKLRL